MFLQDKELQYQQTKNTYRDFFFFLFFSFYLIHFLHCELLNIRLEQPLNGIRKHEKEDNKKAHTND